MFLGIIFDFDNTLYNYDIANESALNKLFETISLENNLNIKKIKSVYKNINTNIKNSNNTNNKFNKTIYIKKLLEELNISLIFLDNYLQLYKNEFNNNFKIYDNVLEVFKFLKNKNIKIAICSNNIFIQQFDKLKKSGLLNYIDFIQTSDECGEEKPNLNIFWNIQNKLAISFENIIFVGDNYEDDIVPSLKLKMLPLNVLTYFVA